MTSDADNHADMAGLNDNSATNAILNGAGDLPSPQDSDASPAAQDNEEETSRSAAVPMQKRRRVTRACDECRRKKIKCDGKQPCTHCTVYSYGKLVVVVILGKSNEYKNVHMISHRTDEEMLHHSMWNRWRANSPRQLR
jgi:hypothetical protein